jgi:hypothetical protein
LAEETRRAIGHADMREEHRAQDSHRSRKKMSWEIPIGGIDHHYSVMN